MGSLLLLQWIFPTQGMNPGLLHCTQILYQLSQKGSPRILEWVKVKVAQLCPTLCDPIQFLESRPEYWSGPFPSPEGLPNPGIEPRSPALQADSLSAEPQGKPKNTGAGSLFLLHGILPTQGLNPALLHYRQILYHLSHKGSPGILEWVAYPFSMGSSQPRDQTQVSYITGRFFTI